MPIHEALGRYLHLSCHDPAGFHGYIDEIHFGFERAWPEQLPILFR